MTVGDELAGGYHSAPVRRGDLVIRAAGSWSRERPGSAASSARGRIYAGPVYVSRDERAGTETLRFIGGQAGTYPLSAPQRSAEALANVARAIRAMHDAASGFIAPEPGNWQHRTAIRPRSTGIGDNDLDPQRWSSTGPASRASSTGISPPSSRRMGLCYAAHCFVARCPRRDRLARSAGSRARSGRAAAAVCRGLTAATSAVLPARPAASCGCPPSARTSSSRSCSVTRSSIACARRARRRLPRGHAAHTAEPSQCSGSVIRAESRLPSRVPEPTLFNLD